MTANSITSDEFAALLKQYPALIKDISSSKPLKPGQKSLEQLDEYRYTEAIQTFSLPNPKRDMALDDVKQLVEWKLRHGKFRPTLMNLVSSNEAQKANKTVKDAFTAYKSPKDITTCLAKLCELRGIGPATASLLLSVRDPSKVLFFSDEAFWWLCCGGQRDSIKYNHKEYELLRAKAAALVKRLDVDATDVEKVAYVLMKNDMEKKTTSASAAKTKSTPKATTPAATTEEKSKGTVPSIKTEKRKTKEEKEPPAGTRQSKRIKK